MKSHIEYILGWYAQRPVDVRVKKERRVPSAIAEHHREEQALRDVGQALNRYYYQSER
jgi:hypothetical protein